MTSEKIFNCPKCSVKLKLPENQELDAKMARCPSCGEWIKLPKESK